VVVSGDAVSRKDLGRRFPATPEAIAKSAAHYFDGTSYLWGGVTPWGADCSGFIQTVFGLHGVSLPRDAADQARCGADSPSGAAELEVGDLLFFSDRTDGRITHVALAIGDARLVHLGLGRGGYAVEELSAGDDYTAALIERMRFARRVIP
jgi:cell wall-associated NlpC family hydrolase